MSPRCAFDTSRLYPVLGSDVREVGIMLNTAIRLLADEKPYPAWRLLERLERVLSPQSADFKLLHAKALESCRQPMLALRVIEGARTLFPHSEAIASYLLRLLAVVEPKPVWTALCHARYVLSQQHSHDDTLRAIRLLKQLHVTPIGRCGFDGEAISGWLLDAASLPALTVTIDGDDFSLKPFLPMPFFLTKGLGSDKDGFLLKVPPNRFRCIRIHLNGSDLAGSPIYFDEPRSKDKTAHPKTPAMAATVDVIVPVYKGLAETKACLESVFASKSRTPHRLIVVNDASPEPDLVAYLNDLAQQDRITLLNQAFNSGFVKTVSRGMEASDSRDIVLLNADTCVQGDWLDKLRTTAYRDNRVGTVTPLSNNGELVSYPTPMQSSAMPSPALLQKLNELGASLGYESAIDIPVGVGFCLYIKRQCLNDAGGFDSDLIERGYGEDTDFCIRASQKGWRNLCAPNVFVAHAGNVSFGAEKAALVKQNVARLYALYPDHSEEYEQFLAQDPLRTSRDFLQRNVLPFLAAGQGELIVLPAVRDGDYRRERLEAELVASGRRLFFLVLLLNPAGQQKISIKLQHQASDQAIDLRYSWPADQQQFWQDLSAAQFKNIDIYDLADWPLEIIQGIADLNRPYQLFLNDYAGYCPQIRLTTPVNGYCGDPAEIEVCESCIKKHGSRVKGISDLRSWRERVANIFANASRVLLPAEEGAMRYRSRFPGNRVQSEHNEINFNTRRLNQANANALIKDGVLRIAVVQAASPDDGFFKLLELARLMASRHIKAEFIVLGRSWDDAALMATGKAWVTGQAGFDEIPLLISQHGCRFVFHAACWPQIDPTPWLIARQCNLPLIAAKVGAFSALLDNTLGDIALDPAQSAKEWLALLVNNWKSSTYRVIPK